MLLLAWMNTIDDTHEFFRIDFTFADSDNGKLTNHDLKFPPRNRKPQGHDCDGECARQSHMRQQTEYARACATHFSLYRTIPAESPAVAVVA